MRLKKMWLLGLMILIINPGTKADSLEKYRKPKSPNIINFSSYKVKITSNLPSDLTLIFCDNKYYFTDDKGQSCVFEGMYCPVVYVIINNDTTKIEKAIVLFIKICVLTDINNTCFDGNYSMRLNKSLAHELEHHRQYSNGWDTEDLLKPLDKRKMEKEAREVAKSSEKLIKIIGYHKGKKVDFIFQGWRKL